VIGDVFLEWADTYSEYVIFLVPAIAFLEASIGVGLFVSGAILLSVCTMLYTQEIASLYQMLPLAFAGATTADHLGYFFGRWIGPAFHYTRFAKRYSKQLTKTEQLIIKRGELSIIFGRLIPAVRSVVPILTGISGLPLARYIRYDLIACSIWVAGLGLLVVSIGTLLT
jgi:membrane-associated protein